MVPHGEHEALWCPPDARSYVDPANPDECFRFTNVRMSKHHQHEESRNIPLHLMQLDLHAHLYSSLSNYADDGLVGPFKEYLDYRGCGCGGLCGNAVFCVFSPGGICSGYCPPCADTLARLKVELSLCAPEIVLLAHSAVQAVAGHLGTVMGHTTQHTTTQHNRTQHDTS